MNDRHPDEYRMSLGDHLDDLRRRIIYALIGPVIATVIMLAFFSTRIIVHICQPILFELQRRGMDDTLHTPTPATSFGLWVTMGVICGLVIGIPWMLYQLWLFASPGLYRHERRFVIYLMPGSAVLATVGVLFMYFVMLPITVWFFVGFNERFALPDLTPTAVQHRIAVSADTDDPVTQTTGEALLGSLPLLNIDPAEFKDGDAWVNAQAHALRVVINGQVYTTTLKSRSAMLTPVFMVDQYVKFVMWMGLAFALAFQLPLVMLLLGFTRLITREQLARGRKWAALVIVVASALLTPADPFSQLVLAIPLYILFEFGLLLMRWFIGQRSLRFDEA